MVFESFQQRALFGASDEPQQGECLSSGRSPVEDGAPETTKAPAEQGLYRGRGGT